MELTKIEYYDLLENCTSHGDCDRCDYGLIGECHLQCTKTYEQYVKEEEIWRKRHREVN